MSKIIFVILFLFVLLYLFPLPTYADPAASFCSQTEATVEEVTEERGVKDYIITVKLNTRIRDNIEGQSPGTNISMTIDGQTSKDTIKKTEKEGEKGVAVFKFGKITPGAHNFSVSINNTASYCDDPRSTKYTITVPDIGQGETTSSTKGFLPIEFNPSSPKSTDVITATVKDLPEDGIYLASIGSVQSYCVQSSNRIAIFTIQPLGAGIYSVQIFNTKPGGTTISCVGDKLVAKDNITAQLSSLPLDLQSRCNTSVKIDQIPNCQYKPSSFVIRCGDNSQGFVCSSPEEVLCMNGEKKEANVVCTKLPPIAQPCKKFVLISDGKTDVTDRVKGNDIDSNKEPFTCVELKTAVGDISTDPKNIIQKIFAVLLSLSGGIALLLIIVSGYHFIASQGNPEKIQGAKETLTSAIVGLLFIIFSMVILEVIGFDILRIPGLTR